MKFRIFFWVSIWWWCIIGNCNGIINEDFEKDIISNNVDDVVDSSNVAKPRQKRFFELWCMNFPDCCDIRGKDRCGFACPVCPIKTDMYGNRIFPTTTKPPQSAPAGQPAALLATLASQGSLASLIGGRGATGSSGGLDLASLAKNPQVLALLQAKQQQQSSQGSSAGGIDLASLLKNPQILSLLQARQTTTPAPKLPADLDLFLQDPKIVKILKEKLKSLPEPTEKPATSVAEVIPGIGALAESFPGGPQALQKVLNDPQVLKFITSNPDIVQGFIKNGLPDPDKLQTLLTLAGPTPEGAETGIFGPNIFADEEFEVQGFGDYDYGDYDDYENDYEDLDEDQFGDFEEDLQNLDENDDKANRDGRMLNSQIPSTNPVGDFEDLDEIDKSSRDGKKLKSEIPVATQKLKENSNSNTVVSYKYRLISHS